MLPLPFYLTRVLDLTTSPAAAFATRFFADLGAETILVEKPDSRAVALEDPGFLTLQRNKLSLALDITRSEATQVLLDLTARCDFVFVDLLENAPPPALEYEAAGARNPSLIYVAVEPSEDRSVGLAAAGAALSALFHRRGTGKGQRIDVGLTGVRASFSRLLAGLEPSDAAAPVSAEPGRESVATATGEVVEQEGVAYYFSSTPAHVRLPAPLLGQHTRQLLRETAGLTDEAIEGLVRQGVVFSIDSRS